MIVLSSEGRTVFIGTLEKWKKGKGEAEDKLTIMSLKGLTMPGDTPKKEKITVLCWNYLSERARKLNVGDVVTVQVAFEAGNSRRGTAERFPKSGLFLTKTRQKLLLLPLSKITLQKKECSCVGELWSFIKGSEWTMCLYTRDQAQEARSKIVPGDSLLCYAQFDGIFFYPYTTQVIHKGRKGEIL